MHIIDLSIRLTDGFPVYPGDPSIHISLAYTHPVDHCQVSVLNMGSHTGTHVDMPLHFLEGGEGCDEIDLSRFIGPAKTLMIPKGAGGCISASDLAGFDIGEDDIVIVCSGWSKNVGTVDFFRDFPYFDESAADFFVEKRIKALGMDFPSVDSATANGAVHRRLLGSGIVLIESLVNLEMTRDKHFDLIALPLNIGNGDGSPVRAVAIIEEI